MNKRATRKLSILSMLVCVQRAAINILGCIPSLPIFFYLNLFADEAFQSQIKKDALVLWVGNLKNCSVGCLAPISPELAPKKVKSNNRGLAVYQLAQTGRDPLPPWWRLSIGPNPLDWN